MEEKKVIKCSSNQLSMEFEHKSDKASDHNYFTYSERLNNHITKQTVVINLNENKKIIEEKNSKQIIEYIINHAKRF